ncbi:MAG: DUF4229 domain-containing protein [Burkholderiales bacterium]|nr:DUF4229 domain-containing protein [Burkholderiales bacterium]
MPAHVRAVLRYTLLRIAIFLVIWLVIDLLTPLSTLWSAAAAILISGAISLVVLDRQRSDAGQVVGGFFSRLNARIDEATRREDVDDAALGQGEQAAQDDAVRQEEEPGLLEDGDQRGSAGSAEHGPDGTAGEGAAERGEGHDR